MENYNETTTEERPKLNPFLSVWLHPKQTARYMINEKSIGFAILILSIGYVGSMMSGLIDSELFPNFSPWLLALLCVIFAPIAGIIGTAFSALITWLFGKLFKGTGTYSDLFKGLSLTAVPSIVLIPLYIIWIMTSPDSLLDPNFMGALPWIFWPTILVTIVVSIWSFVISVGVVAEAHQISNWMAFFTIFIPSIILFIVFFVLFFIILIGIMGVSMM
ncbi:Yip1 family protein [Lysinibacillus cavernae]|uniref:Yip1 family protein n=1 Tax=Lysinibacillus cavernae TaxID=2666135 RepID=UPI0012D96223|nr:Yip1 family protein [Lysinibacillus cavernae]